MYVISWLFEALRRMKFSLNYREGSSTVPTGVAVFLVALFICLFIPSIRNTIFAKSVFIYEDVALLLAPSADRAYAYGTRHFNATDPAHYNLARAEKMYTLALSMDPAFPYTHHQIARIAFLKGDHARALVHINESIDRDPDPSSFYIRGLIKGFVGDYEGAARDYRTFLREKPTSWAGINDYAWVLLKADRPLEALVAVDWGLIYSPENVWLYNNKATAHMELGQYELAYDAALRAQEMVGGVSEEEWLRAYPGNDPLIAAEGIEALKNAIEINIHTISLAIEKQENDVP